MMISTHLNNLANFSKIAKSTAGNKAMRRLPSDYQLGPKDVLCQRGKDAWLHNKHYRTLLEGFLERYSKADNKMSKSVIVSDVVDAIREQGNFVRCVNGIWHDVGDSIAREKVGGTFRDRLDSKYKSRSKSKAKRERIREGKASKQQQSLLSGDQNYVLDIEPIPLARQVTPSPPSSKVVLSMSDVLQSIATRREEILSSIVQLEPLAVISCEEVYGLSPEIASSEQAFPDDLEDAFKAKLSKMFPV